MINLMSLKNKLIFETNWILFQERIRFDKQKKSIKNKFWVFFGLKMMFLMHFVIIKGDMIDNKYKYWMLIDRNYYRKIEIQSWGIRLIQWVDHYQYLIQTEFIIKNMYVDDNHC